MSHKVAREAEWELRRKLRAISSKSPCLGGQLCLRSETRRAIPQETSVPRSTLQRGVTVRIRKVRHPPSRAWEMWKPDPGSVKGGVWRPLARVDRSTQCGLPPSRGLLSSLCKPQDQELCTKPFRVCTFRQCGAKVVQSWKTQVRRWLSRGGRVYPSGRYMQTPVMD